MKNCMEWLIGEQAIFCVAGATVPLYDTLGADSVEVSLLDCLFAWVLKSTHSSFPTVLLLPHYLRMEMNAF
jgi:long-subunit acyl-CoA synthetase (AMP-forming)